MGVNRAFRGLVTWCERAQLRWLIPWSDMVCDDRRMRRFASPCPTAPPSAFKGFRFPAEVIVLAVRWYLRYKLTYRDVEELLAERGVDVDHVTIWRWVQRFGATRSR